MSKKHYLYLINKIGIYEYNFMIASVPTRNNRLKYLTPNKSKFIKIEKKLIVYRFK